MLNKYIYHFWHVFLFFKLFYVCASWIYALLILFKSLHITALHAAQKCLNVIYYAKSCHYTIYTCVTISFLASLHAVLHQRQAGHVNCQLLFIFVYAACLSPPCLRIWHLSLKSLSEQKYTLEAKVLFSGFSPWKVSITFDMVGICNI